MTFAILYFLNTVPSVDSSIPVAIRPVVTHNMLHITVFVNVRKSVLLFCMHHICTQSQRNTVCCVNNMLNRNISVGNYMFTISVYARTCDKSGPVLMYIIMITCIV